jgi:hypothetical protein
VAPRSRLGVSRMLTMSVGSAQQSQPELLGLVQGHYPIDDSEDFLGDLDSTKKLGANAGIAIVVPTHDIREVLMGDRLEKDRDELRTKHEQERPTPVLDIAGGTEQRSEFESFDALASSEIGAKRKREG